MTTQRKCSNCGFESPAGFAFCGGCGAKLGVLVREPEEMRREVAVLFADVVGFTSLAEHLDPEELRSLVSEFLRRLASRVYSFGGRIDMYAGDALMATFGAPVAHENDALLACRAALAMLEARSIPTSGAPALNIRIGINLGEVVFGRIADSDRFTVLGDAVNVASRLQTSAQPDTAYASSTVVARCSPWIIFEPVGQLQVKNRARPIHTFRLLEECKEPHPDRGISGEAVWVNRQVELVQVEEWIQALSHEDCPHRLLVLSGDGGIGKSRLWTEARQRDPSGDVRILEVSCPSIAAGIPLSSVRALVLAWLGLPARAPTEHAMMTLREHLSLLGFSLQGEEADVLALVLSGIPEGSLAARDPRDRLDLVTNVLVRVLLREEEVCPLVIQLDNYQWADPVGRDLLLSVVSRLQRGGCIVLGREAVGNGHGLPTVLLGPLSSSDATELACAHLGGLQALGARVAALAGGNPYYVEELIRQLMSEGYVSRDDGGSVVLSRAVDEIPLPATLAAFITQKVDGCGPDARRVLGAVSIARDGDIELLTRISGVPDTRSALTELERRYLVTSQASGRVTASCDLVSAAAVKTLLHAERRRLHSAAADALIERQIAGEDQLAGLITHLEGAGRMRELVPWLLEAGTRAVNQGMIDQGLSFMDRAGESAQSLGEHSLVARVVLRRAEVLLLGGRPADAIAELDALPSDLTPSHRAEGLARKLRALIVKGALPAAAAMVPDCLAVEEQLAVSVRGDLHADLAQLQARMGNWEQASREAQETLDIGRSRNDDLTQAAGHNVLGIIAMARGETVRAAQHLEQALAIFQAAHRSMNTAGVVANLGLLHLRNEEAARALPYLREALVLGAQTGNVIAEASATNNLGIAQMWMAEWNDAERLFLRARQLYAAIGSPPHEGSVLLNQATSRRLQGRWDEASACLSERTALLAPTADRFHDDIALRDAVLLQYQRGAPEQVLALCGQGAEHPIDEADSLTLFLKAMHALASMMIGRSEGLDAETSAAVLAVPVPVLSERLDLLRVIILNDLWHGRPTSADTVSLVREAARRVKDPVPSLDAALLAAIATWDSLTCQEGGGKLDSLATRFREVGMPYQELVAAYHAARGRRVGGCGTYPVSHLERMMAQARRIGNPILLSAVEKELSHAAGSVPPGPAPYRAQI